jgi:hypothetical protein
LNEALAEQRVAIAAWRNALADLKGTTDGLRGSLQTYQTNLQTLGDSVSGVHAKALSLEAWADSVAARDGAATGDAAAGSVAVEAANGGTPPTD